MAETTILIVDDDKITRSTLSMALSDEYATHTAKNGKEALELLDQEEVDLVLSDLSMPGMSGIDASNILKRIMPEVKIVMLTIYDIEEYREAAKTCGASGFIWKKSIAHQLLLKFA